MKMPFRGRLKRKAPGRRAESNRDVRSKTQRLLDFFRGHRFARRLRQEKKPVPEKN